MNKFFRLLSLSIVLAYSGAVFAMENNTNLPTSTVSNHEKSNHEKSNHEKSNHEKSNHEKSDQGKIETTHEPSPCFGKEFLGDVDVNVNQAVTEQTWASTHNSTGVFNKDIVKEQFRKDVLLWHATIFKQPPANNKLGGKQLEQKHLDKLKETQDFLKRWILMLAYCQLSYVTNTIF